jgi:hypothetical protein
MAQGTKNSKGENWDWKGGDLTRKLHIGMMKNMYAACNTGKNIVVNSFGGGLGSGKTSTPHQPPAVKTGHLRRSINFDVKSLGPLKIRGRIGTGIGSAESVGYAVFLEFGTMPHTIIAHGEALMFIGSGGLTFRESVNHPGFVQRPFLRPLIWKKSNKDKLEEKLGRKIL